MRYLDCYSDLHVPALRLSKLQKFRHLCSVSRSLTNIELFLKNKYTHFLMLKIFHVATICLRFGGFEEFKRHNASPDGTLTAGRKLFCGMGTHNHAILYIPFRLGAGVCEAILVVTPMETVKVKFINDQVSANPHYRGFFHGVRAISKEYGLGGLYKGVTPTIFKQGTNQAIRFFVMETMKELYRGYRGDTTANQPVPKLVTGLFGILAGAASVYGNTPLDVVKTRMQVRRFMSLYEFTFLIYFYFLLLLLALWSTLISSVLACCCRCYFWFGVNPEF
ncbi:unnamed protein product [Dibothriocephalus latus]|uniref:Citrate transport protein n=1 Tax=Dibothriocephalus latus TaxID=60516 RepID=A0A3P7NWA6_DIBLA|nr:unnamed protein product [Dibothriocephalus latus]